MYPTQPFFYVNNDVISMRLHDWSTGGLLLVCPLVVSIIPNWEAAIRYRRAAAERTSRPSDSPGTHDDCPSIKGRRRTTERLRRAQYNETPVQNDVAWGTTSPPCNQSSTPLPSRGTSPTGQRAVSPSRRRRRSIVPLRYAVTAAPLRVTASFFMFFLFLVTLP